MEQAIYKSPPTLVPTDKLVMFDVVNPQGEDMGQTQVFLIDLCSGKVAFAIVSFEGTLGISDKWFALPTDLLSWSIPRGKFVLDLPREVLEQAPGIDKNKWPKEIDLAWLEKACDHYGCTPYWAM